ncbi:hypothetical protein FF2_037308 [Malus domestica]
MGVAYLMAKSGLAVASMSVMRSEMVMKSIEPVVMAGLLGGMKVDAKRDESSTYVVMLASDKKLRDSQEGNVVKRASLHGELRYDACSLQWDDGILKKA